jgi:hypothetical protein
LATASWVGSPRAFIAPLALAQFICSFAGSNMNVMINDISHDPPHVHGLEDEVVARIRHGENAVY